MAVPDVAGVDIQGALQLDAEYGAEGKAVFDIAFQLDVAEPVEDAAVGGIIEFCGAQAQLADGPAAHGVGAAGEKGFIKGQGLLFGSRFSIGDARRRRRGGWPVRWYARSNGAGILTLPRMKRQSTPSLSDLMKPSSAPLVSALVEKKSVAIPCFLKEL